MRPFDMDLMCHLSASEHNVYNPRCHFHLTPYRQNTTIDASDVGDNTSSVLVCIKNGMFSTVTDKNVFHFSLGNAFVSFVAAFKFYLTDWLHPHN